MLNEINLDNIFAMIKGNKVALRNVLEDDLLLLFRNTVDLSDAGEFMPLSLISYSSLKKQFDIDGFWSRSFGKLLIEDGDNNIVGEVGFCQTTHYVDGVEIYFRLYALESRNRGLMTEALAIFLCFLFQSESFNRIQAVTVVGNLASQKVLEKSGFQLEGKMRKARMLRGKHVDLNMYSILRTDAIVNESYIVNGNKFFTE